MDSLVDPGELVEWIRRAYLSESAVPQRTAMSIGDAWIGSMPGYVAGMGYALKVVGIFPRSEPRVRGLVVLANPETGEFPAVIDGSSLTGWRTAAASALAYGLMGGGRIGEMAVVGTGAQAAYHVLVFRRLYSPRRIVVYGRTPGRAEALAGRLGVEAGEGDGYHDADVVVAATNSREPVLRGSRLAGGSVVLSVGAPRPVRELDDGLLARARCALVDNVEGVLTETDDRAPRLVGLGDALRGAPCEWGDVKLYKSVGYALLDVAAGWYIYSRAVKALS